MFWNPCRNSRSRQYEAVVGDAMRKMGVDPAIVYAFEKVGFLATEKNWPVLDAVQRQEWEDAIDEYKAIPED
jgi:hypothetical protein